MSAATQAPPRLDEAGQDRLRLVTCLLGALALVAGPGIAALNPTTDALLIAATALILLVPVVVRAVQGRFDPFEPIFIFVMAYGVMFVVRPAAMLINNDMGFMIADRSVDLQATFRPAVVLGLLGAVGFVGGYFLRAGERAAERIPAPPQPDMRRVVVGATALWFLGAAMYGLFLVQSSAGGSVIKLLLSGRSLELTQAYKNSSAYLYSSPFLMVAATLILFAAALSTRNRRVLAGSVLSTILLCGLLGPTGSRTVLFPLVLGLGVIYYTTRGRRPRALSLVVVTLLALFVSSVLLDVRSSATRQQVGAVAAVKQNVRDPLRMFVPLTRDADAAELPALAAAVAVVPEEVPHEWGRGTLRDVLARPIPHQLWAGKPKQPKERVIAAIWPDAYEVGAANPEFSVLLSFFIDGGYPGAVLGMLLYGVLSAALYWWYLRNAASVGARAIFASALPFIVSGVRDTPVDTLQRVGMVAFPVLVIFYFFVSPERTGRVSLPRVGRPLSARTQS
ncbi:MAG TPA: O-antigen polymerase [Solirubrobacteraceae bacterium]|jgi:hypothetical protein